ncbi:Oidioi.mRNA.OKI2018_I69.chr1.g2840.t1.cds [Oikopleura dioica]|uniref:Protein farnesyltransferase subunit beta n=1 Tax=Oikopleura dioica TaxID=34765 RepID=A0ABN7SS87_OIKDI|nr:Oidioi.mRNA.OKI2018_I69.chr1.g2840.t1.cds [Oikopleura dioica]
MAKHDRLKARLAIHDNTVPNVFTTSTESQSATEGKVVRLFQEFVDKLEIQTELRLDVRKHISYASKGLSSLGPAYESLDASRPWIVYWTTHALDLLDVVLSDDKKTEICEFLELCQSKNGGFGGGPLQMPHLATTYAAMNAIAILGSGGFERAYQIVNVKKLEEFLYSVKNTDGSFAMHVNGETDTRAIYCAASVATMLQLEDKDKLFDKTDEYLAKCQSWDGGFGPNPGAESHGGFTYTSLAALALLNKTSAIPNVSSLVRWLCNRQKSVEGGFDGRANKLVDSCYNFWQGGSFPIVHGLLDQDHAPKDSWLCDSRALMDYTFLACQVRQKNSVAGGFADRPGSHRDYYHTCYALSGVAALQHVYNRHGQTTICPEPESENCLSMINPLHNVRPIAVIDIYDYFSAQLEIEKELRISQS